MVTVEAAYALSALAVFVVLSVAAIGGVAAQLRCTDAAREVARLAAAGDPAATRVGAQVAPKGARIEVRTEGDRVVATVVAKVPLLAMSTSRRAASPRGNRPASSSRIRDDAGFTTIAAALAIAGLATLVVAMSYLGAAVLARHRAQNAADLGALAAASAQLYGGDYPAGGRARSSSPRKVRHACGRARSRGRTCWSTSSCRCGWVTSVCGKRPRGPGPGRRARTRTSAVADAWAIRVDSSEWRNELADLERVRRDMRL